MLRPEDIMMAVSATVGDNEAAENAKANPANLEVKQAVEQIQKYEYVDYLQSDAALAWLCNHKITLAPSKHSVLMDCIHKLNYAPNSDDIIIHCKSREDQQVFKLELVTLMVEHLGREKYADSEFRDVVMLSPDFLAGLMGFRNVVCERDSVSRNMPGASKILPLDTKELQGNLEFKLPFFLKKHGPKILAYILGRLEKHGFSPALFENTHTLPTIEELLLSLPDLPADKLDYKTQQLFKKYEELEILRLQDSLTALGFIRVLTDNFEKMLFSLSKLPTTDAKWAAEKLKEATVPSLGVAINPLLLMQMIAAMERKKGVKPLPHFRIGNPVHIGKQALLPARIEVPHSHNLISRPTLSIIICDVSGSMSGDRNNALRVAAMDQCQQLALLPNQMVCGVALGDNGATIQEPTALNIVTLPKILQVFGQLPTGGGTCILPTLREVKKHIEAADPNMDIQVLLITDGEFNDQNDAEVTAILRSHRKVVWRALGIDLKVGGKEERNLKFLLNETEELGGRQLVFCPAAEVKAKMEHLISKTVPISLLKEVSFNIPLAGNKVWTQLPTFSRGMPVFRHLPISQSMLDVAKAMKLQDIPIQIKCVNKDGKTQFLNIMVPYLAFTKTKPISEFNALYFSREWLQTECITNNLGDLEKLSDETLMRLYNKASELQLADVCEYLRERLDSHLTSWLQQKLSDAKKDSKAFTLAALGGLLNVVSAQKQKLYIDILSTEVNKLANDPEVHLEEILFKDLKVKSTSELEAVSLDRKYASYQKILGALLKGNVGFKLPEGFDIKVLQESIFNKMSTILCRLQFCKAAEIELLDSVFEKFIEDEVPKLKVVKPVAKPKDLGDDDEADVEGDAEVQNVDRKEVVDHKAVVEPLRVSKILAAYEKAFAAIKSDINLEVSIKTKSLDWLEQQINEIWLSGNFEAICAHRFDERGKLGPAMLLTHLQLLKEKANNEGRASQNQLLTQEINEVWMDGTLCLYVHKQTALKPATKEQFKECNPRIRFLAYQHAMEQALLEERPAAHKQLETELNEFWLEGFLCTESKQDTMADFQKLSLEQQMEFYVAVEKIARELGREKEVKEIADCMLAIEDNQIILQFASQMFNVKDLKAFVDLPILNRIKVVKWASLSAASEGKPGTAARLSVTLEALVKATQKNGGDIKEEQEADRLLHAASYNSDFNQVVSDVSFTKKVPHYHLVISEQRYKNPEMAALIENRLFADTFIHEALMNQVKTYKDYAKLQQENSMQRKNLRDAHRKLGQCTRKKDGSWVDERGRPVSKEKFAEFNPMLTGLFRNSDGGILKYRTRVSGGNQLQQLESIVRKRFEGGTALLPVTFLELVIGQAEQRYGKNSKEAEIIINRANYQIGRTLPRLLKEFIQCINRAATDEMAAAKRITAEGARIGMADCHFIYEAEKIITKYSDLVGYLLEAGLTLADTNGFSGHGLDEKQCIAIVREVCNKDALKGSEKPKANKKVIKNMDEIIKLIDLEFERDPNHACQGLMLVLDESTSQVRAERKALEEIAVRDQEKVLAAIQQKQNVNVVAARPVAPALVERLAEAQNQLGNKEAVQVKAGVNDAAPIEKPKPIEQPKAVRPLLVNPSKADKGRAILQMLGKYLDNGDRKEPEGKSKALMK